MATSDLFQVLKHAGKYLPSIFRAGCYGNDGMLVEQVVRGWGGACCIPVGGIDLFQPGDDDDVVFVLLKRPWTGFWSVYMSFG